MPQVGPGPGAYMLPPTVGYKDHDYTRYRNPEYSMAQRLQALKPSTLGPGPKYEVSEVTKYGRITSPTYSLSSRPKPLTSFKPPGPGTYSPEKFPRMKEPRPPAYSMASRFKGWKPECTPSPNQYPLPTTLGPKVPNLPSSAAYTMVGKHCLKGAEQSPGPARYGETNTDVVKVKAPKYSMSGNRKQVVKCVGPGPAGYLPEPTRCTLAPGYSFGHRTTNEPYITASDNMPCKNKP